MILLIWRCLGGAFGLIQAILFDLDGTLSLMDQEEFMRNYVGLLAPRFSHLIPPDRFAKQLLRSTEIMIREPREGRTNQQTFFDDFCRATGLSFNTLWPIFEEFYRTDFPALKCLVKTNPDGKKVVECAQKQGYIIAMASNPVMPLAAMNERIRWAELSPEQFALVPALEEFHFCKPQLGFFQEIAFRLGLSPQNCLMVGNHPIDDMAPRSIGMKTFLLGESDSETPSDYAGDLVDLIHLLLQGNL